ncbi:putative predicted protein [Rhizobium favelukesii]|uniref:Uncharacterized protein n=1 Tax=Rhizobium favelukesii TaxID=348824 RepID=W6RAU4_9HYPH|nr:putative predicted protein [Rhizobium favelukesii]
MIFMKFLLLLSDAKACFARYGHIRCGRKEKRYRFNFF